MKYFDLWQILLSLIDYLPSPSLPRDNGIAFAQGYQHTAHIKHIVMLREFMEVSLTCLALSCFVGICQRRLNTTLVRIFYGSSVFTAYLFAMLFCGEALVYVARAYQIVFASPSIHEIETELNLSSHLLQSALQQSGQVEMPGRGNISSDLQIKQQQAIRCVEALSEAIISNPSFCGEHENCLKFARLEQLERDGMAQAISYGQAHIHTPLVEETCRMVDFRFLSFPPVRPFKE